MCKETALQTGCKSQLGWFYDLAIYFQLIKITLKRNYTFLIIEYFLQRKNNNISVKKVLKIATIVI